MAFSNVNNNDSGLVARTKINAGLTFLNSKEADINSIVSKEDTANKGAANGYAPLDAGSKVPAVYLPSYVDDILEFANLAAFPVVGETGKIYIALDTNKQYRWSGAVYVELVASPGTTDAVPEGIINLYFTTARVLATLLAGISFASGAVITAADSVLSALGKLQKQISDNLTALNTLTNRTKIDFQSITAGSFALNSATFTDIPGVTLTTKTTGGESNLYEATFNCSRTQTGGNPHNYRIVYESAPAVFTSAQLQSLASSTGDVISITASIPALPAGRIIKVQKQKVGMAASTDTSLNHILMIKGINTNNIIP